MPIYTVQGPDGKTYEIEGPAGATAEQLGAVISGQAAAPAAAAPDPIEGMSTTDQVLAGAGKSMYDLYRGSKQALGIGDQAELQAEINDSKRMDRPLAKSGGGMAGGILGNAAMALPTALIPGANTVTGGALVGGVMGALDPVADGESRLMNTGVGAAGGAAGSMLAKALGRFTNPVQSRLTPELQDLADKAAKMGIPLDAADKTGSRPLKVIRSVMESLPLTADKQGVLNDAKRQAFNKVALANIGETADRATPNVLNAARQRIGNQFDTLTANKSIPLGDDFLETLAKIDSGVTPFSSPGIRGAVDKGLEVAQKGQISGPDYQKIRSVLGTSANDAFKGSNAELGQALKSIRGGFDDSAAKAMTGAEREAWKTANKQWQNLKILEKAAAPTSADAVAGNVSPAKLAQALMSIDKNGMTYGTRGDNMGDLARIGQAFVKDQIPNSGTAERSMWQEILTGNPIESLWKTGVGGVSMPVQKAINSKAGQAYLSNGLVPMNEKTKMLARMLQQATVGAGAGLPVVQRNTNE